MRAKFLLAISGLIDRFQAKFPPNRLTALAMLVLAAPAAALGGYIAVWVPKHFPGLPAFTPDQYTAFLITGAGAVVLAGIAAGYKFIDGCQKDEANRFNLAVEEAHLETKERIAVAQLASTAFEAAELLGLGGAGGTPVAAVAAASPPPPPSPVVTPPSAPPVPQEAAHAAVAAPDPPPPVPVPPHQAAQAVAAVGDPPPSPRR